MNKIAYGIDIGGTSIKIGKFDIKGELMYRWEIPTRKDNGGSLILGEICDEIRRENETDGIPDDMVQGLGIVVPGPVIDEKTVNKCVNIGWGVINVAEEITRLTGIENVKVANDANAAALGEMWKGGGVGYKNAVLLTLGTGVGGGIILNGKIHSGRFGSAGEIGHIIMSQSETTACGCGKKGHLEQYASATGIVRRANELLAESQRPSMLREADYLSAKEVFDCAKKGDEVSLEIVDFVGEMLGRACSYVSCIIDPEIFVIGGGVSRAGDILLDTIKNHYIQYAFHASTETEFSLAKLGNDAGMYGAVKMVL